MFNVVNAGKKSFAVDLTTDAGTALVKELIATADVVVNNFRPGAMERMGFGFDELTRLKPDIVSLNLPGAHRNGPWAVRPSMGNILMAASGFNMLTGFDGERPRGIGIGIPRLHRAASARCQHPGGAAPARPTRDRSGDSSDPADWNDRLVGRRVDAIQGHRRAAGSPSKPRSEPVPATASSRRWRPNTATTNGSPWPSTADEQFASLCELLGQPELVEDARFQTHALRKANEDALDAIVTAWTRDQDKWQLSDILQSAGIAAAPVEHLAETFERDPQLRNHYQTVQQPSRPDVDIPVNREAAQWVGHQLRLTRAPSVGEHNRYVVCDVLGRSDEDFVQLLVDDVLS